MNENFRNQLDRRLATVEGHVKAVRKMVSENQKCVDILTQITAIQRAVKKAGMELLKNHMGTCVKGGLKEGNESLADELNLLLGVYLWID
ncbi:MAG: metal-sensitive transcriptional regulator [Firmicutes bacterium]|nr:metal-sensitive transcriptional regulator [Bacillota bacterium]